MIDFPTQDSHAQTEKATRYAWYVLLILTLTQVVNYIDRQVLPPLLPLIKDDLHLTDEKVGLLGTGFMIVHSVTAIPLGILADRWARRKVIAFGLGFWSVATVFSGLSRSFSHLMIARAAVGIGEAAYAPAATSLLSDSFPKSDWGKVIGIFNLGLVIGGGLGLVLGGVLGESLGWQACFFVVGAPGLLLTLATWTFREPLRGIVKEKEKHDFTSILGIPTLWLVILGAAGVTFAAGALIHWLPIFVTRYFNVTPKEASLRLAPIAIAGLLGVLSGGVIADYLYRRHPAGRAIAMAGAFLFTIPFLLWGLFAQSLTQFLIAGFFIVYFMSWYHGPVAAIVSEIVPSSLRGTAIAFYMFCIHILGDTPAPFIVGYLSDRLAGGLRHAMLLTVIATGLGAMFFLALIPALKRRTRAAVGLASRPAAVAVGKH
jgi:predicted MFS family arabinose efflux permease